MSNLFHDAFAATKLQVTWHEIFTVLSGFMRWIGCLAIGVTCSLITYAQTPDPSTPTGPPSTAAESIAQAKQQLQDIESQILRITPKIKAAVVCIEGGGGSGSGVIVSEDGLILTAAHVIEGATKLNILFSDGRKLPGKPLGTYGPADAGMAQIEVAGPFPWVEVASGADMKLHDPVIALGHPGGFDSLRGTPLRLGYLNAIEDNFIQSDNALIGGDSGGPTFDLQGRVIGIHSHISESLGVNRDASIRAFHLTWDAMKRGEHHATHYSHAIGEPQETDPWILGLRLISGVEERGWVVDEIALGSPAARAGLCIADVIEKVNGNTIASADRFLSDLAQGKLGESIHIEGYRELQALEFDVPLMRRSTYDANRKKEMGDESELKPAPQPSADRQTAPKRERHSLAPPAAKAIPNSRLQELKDQAKANGGRLQLSREELRALRASLSKRGDAIATMAGARIEGLGTVNWKLAYEKICAGYQNSLHRVMVGGRWTALATAVSIDGFLITKASEVKNREIEIELAPNQVVPAKLVQVDEGLDLALISVPRAVLKPISLSFASDKKEMGTLCAAMGLQPTPTGYGAISVVARPLDGKTGAYWGARTEVQEGKLIVTAIQPGSPANTSGLKTGDWIKTVDDAPLSTPEDVTKHIQSLVPGDTVSVTIQRANSLQSMRVKLIDGSAIAPMPGSREQGTDGASTAMSRHRWGFRTGIQHDCAIHPHDCGGPLIDLDGRIIGINIARAGRIHSYAIPIEQVASFVHEYTTQPQATSMETSP